MKHVLRFLVAAAIIGGLFYLGVWVFGWNRMVSDFWPVDKGTVSPNLLASLIVGTIVTLFTTVFYKPAQRAISNWFHRRNAALHAKLDASIALSQHIIKNSRAIPNDHGVDIPPAGVPKQTAQGQVQVPVQAPQGQTQQQS